MDQLSAALREIIGKAPRYMRSPYFSANDLTLRTLGELNFHVVHASIDTLDWQNDSPDAIGTSVQLFSDGLDGGGNLALAHDVHQWTANTLTQAMIDEVKARGLRGRISSLDFHSPLHPSVFRFPYNDIGSSPNSPLPFSAWSCSLTHPGSRHRRPMPRRSVECMV
jgi:hypothetical protein